MKRISRIMVLAYLSMLNACSEEPLVNSSDLQFLSSSTLPSILQEASGVEIDENGNFWSINDSGNDALLIGFNSDGSLHEQLSLSSLSNIDWEDLAYENETLYIGDFGNNDNDRVDLKIYKLPDFLNIDAGNAGSVTTSIINFSLEDQDQFPPADNNLHFDMEAFFVFENQIYLFSKDRSDPFAGITKMYILDDEAGTQIAKLAGTFSTSSDKKEGAITSADISPDGSKIVLISEELIYLFTDFVTVPSFLEGTVKRYTYQQKRKYEGVVFTDDCHLEVVNEDKYDVLPSVLNIKICD